MEKVFQYPALNDNYNWIITCPETRECAGVDIYNTDIFFDYIEKNNLNLVALLNTHHHNDHMGGNEQIFQKYKNLKFYAGKYDFENKRIAHQTNILSEGDRVKVGNIILNVLDVPGHTLGHVCYYNDEFAFVGDTLFASGCGRLFEGTPAQMFESLSKIVEKIPHSAKIYCGHEYTLSNLKFCDSLNSEYFKDYKKQVEDLRSRNIQTVPTTLEKELKFNPFLMVIDKNLKDNVFNFSDISSPEAFRILREKKDRF